MTGLTKFLLTRSAALRTRATGAMALFPRSRQTHYTTVAAVLAGGSAATTVDHLTPVDRAAQLMADSHVDAIPVTKHNKVVGLLTERDYFNKVLNAKHQAARSTMVCEVATMGPDLVVASPEDTVVGCLEVMMRKNLIALPVVGRDGQAVGTVSAMDLTKQYLDEHLVFAHLNASPNATTQASNDVPFSEPPEFPENWVKPDGAVHSGEDLLKEDLFARVSADLEAAATAYQAQQSELEEVATQSFSEGSVFPELSPTEEVMLAKAQEEADVLANAAAAAYLDEQCQLEERATNAFSEGSVFPEYSATEEVLLTQAQRDAAKQGPPVITGRDLRVDAAHAELLDKIDKFSEPSDFPEAAPVDEVIQSRAA